VIIFKRLLLPRKSVARAKQKPNSRGCSLGNDFCRERTKPSQQCPAAVAEGEIAKLIEDHHIHVDPPKQTDHRKLALIVLAVLLPIIEINQLAR